MGNIFEHYCSLNNLLTYILYIGGRSDGSHVLSIWEPDLYWWEQLLGNWKYTQSGEQNLAKSIQPSGTPALGAAQI